MGVGLAMLTAMGATVLRPVERDRQVDKNERDSFETSIRWTVMTILSIFPYINYMGWVFAAVDASYSLLGTGPDDKGEDGYSDEVLYYGSLALLYLIPYLIEGFRFDSFTVTTICMGAAHVQLERVRYYGGGEQTLLLSDTHASKGVSRFQRAIQALVQKETSASGDNDDEDEVTSLEEDYLQRNLEELDEFDKRLEERWRNE
jgi:hypothetical protein